MNNRMSTALCQPSRPKKSIKGQTTALMNHAPALRSQCVILTSPESEGSEWVHTRGMRKFGRPDISIHGVKPEWRSAAIGLCDRFIEFQALGGLVGEGLEVNSPGFPEGFTCCGGGKLEDPEFGNALIEIRP